MQEQLPTRRQDSGPAISIRDVRLTLPSRAGPVEILRGVDLDVARGQSVAVVGPSGSGKSTLLMIMAGLERPTSGDVHVVGQDLKGLSEDALARLRGSHIGIVFQSFHLVPTMTALENVALPLEFAGRADAEKAALAALESVELGHRPGHFPAQLSGGEQQRVALARAMAPEPSIILADEPTGNLDGRTGEHVMDLLFALKDRLDATLLLITHDRSVAARCERLVEMRDGLVLGSARENFSPSFPGNSSPSPQPSPHRGEGVTRGDDVQPTAPWRSQDGLAEDRDAENESRPTVPSPRRGEGQGEGVLSSVKTRFTARGKVPHK